MISQYIKASFSLGILLWREHVDDTLLSQLMFNVIKTNQICMFCSFADICVNMYIHSVHVDENRSALYF